MYFVDFPNLLIPGHFTVCDAFDTRVEAEAYCAQWGAVNGKLDLISEGEIEDETEDETEDEL